MLRKLLAGLRSHWDNQEAEYQGDWSKQAEDDVEIQDGIFVSREAFEEAQRKINNQQNGEDEYIEENPYDNQRNADHENQRNPYEQYQVLETRGHHSKLQAGWIRVAAFIGTPVVWGIASFGVGQWLSGFRPLSWDLGVIAFYTSAAVWEFIGIALLFISAREYVNHRSYWKPLAGAIFVAISTFLGQFLLLYSDVVRNFLFIPPDALKALPFGESWIIYFRALLPSVLEFFLVFLIAEEKKPDVHETIAQRRKVAQEVAMLEEEDTTSRQTRVAREAVTMLLEGATGILQQQMKQLREGQQIIQTEIHPKTFVHRIHETEYLGSGYTPEEKQPHGQPPKSVSAIVPTSNKFQSVELSLDVEDVPKQNGHKAVPQDSPVAPQFVPITFQDSTIPLETGKTSEMRGESAKNNGSNGHVHPKLPEQVAEIKPSNGVKQEPAKSEKQIDLTSIWRKN